MLYQHATARRPISLAAAIAYAKAFGCAVSEISPRLALQLEQAANPSAQDQSGPIAKGASLAAGTVSIDVLDVAASMGMGEPRAETENVIHRLSIGLDWVRDNIRGTSSTANLRVVSGRGTSMEPTYSDGAILVVDIGDRTVRDNQVYVLSAGDRIFVKRVHQRVDGRFDITSDNPTAKGVETLSGDHEVTVHGRVVWAWNGRKV